MDAAEKYKNRHRAVIEYANGAMFKIAELDRWALANKRSLSFERLFSNREYVLFEHLAYEISCHLVPEDMDPDDARRKLRDAHDTAKPEHPVSRYRDLVMIRFDNELLAAVYDDKLNLFDTLTYGKIDVEAARLGYNENPDAYLEGSRARILARTRPSTLEQAPQFQTSHPLGMDFISISAVLDALAKGIDAPQADDESDEDMQMWRISEAAGKLHADLHNASQDNRPRWASLHKVTGFPVFDDSVADEGNAILLHAAGWYLREKKTSLAHIVDCIRSGLDPAVVGPAPRDPNAGQWQGGASSFRQYQIGFDRAELAAFLGNSASVLADIPSRPEARASIDTMKSAVPDELRALACTAQPVAQNTQEDYIPLANASRSLAEMQAGDLSWDDGIVLAYQITWQTVIDHLLKQDATPPLKEKVLPLLARCQDGEKVRFESTTELQGAWVATENLRRIYENPPREVIEKLDNKRQDAAEEARQREAARHAAGRYTLGEAAEILDKQGGERKTSMSRKLCEAAFKGELPVYEPGRNARYEYGQGKDAKEVRDFYEEARWDELNQWLEKNEPHITSRFLAPGSVVSQDTSNPEGQKVESKEEESERGAENGVSQPPAVPSPDIAAAFAGLKGWDAKRWSRALGDPPKWLKSARVQQGSRKSQIPAAWNPVKIALDVYGDGNTGVTLTKLDAIFARQSLKAWESEWEIRKEYLCS